MGKMNKQSLYQKVTRGIVYLWEEGSRQIEHRDIADHYTRRANSPPSLKDRLVEVESGKLPKSVGDSSSDFTYDEYGIIVGLKAGEKYFEVTPNESVEMARRFRVNEKSFLCRLADYQELQKQRSIVPFNEGFDIGANEMAALALSLIEEVRGGSQ